MSTSSDSNLPFGFWLVQNFFPAKEDQTEDQAPITNREFYISMAMVMVAFGLYCLFMKGLIL